MPNLSTSLGSFFNTITSTVGQITDFAQDIAPAVNAGIGIASQFGLIDAPRAPSPTPAPRPAGPAQPADMPAASIRPVSQFLTTQPMAMPGGSAVNVSTSGGGALTRVGLAGDLVAGGINMLSANEFGGLRSPFGSSICITPTQTKAGMRLPRIVNVPNPSNPNVIDTYVKAPRPRFKVSVSGPRRRRCVGGR